MSELFGKNDENIAKRNILKDDFGWEIPVEIVPIPSQGKVYSPESVLYKKEKIKVKAMTAQEEDILSSNAYLKEGTAFNHLIKSCVLEPGFNPNELLLGDRNALMIVIRITGYGAKYNLSLKCRNCYKKNNIDIQLTDIPIKRLKIQPVLDGQNLFEYELPISKKKVKFRFITVADEIESIKKREALERNNIKKPDSDITDILSNSIVEIEGIRDKTKINHFVRNMPAYDSKSFRKYLREEEPGMDMNSTHICEYCDHKNDFSIPINFNFFWPDE